MVNALRGGACKPHSKVVTALDVYAFVHAFMVKSIDKYNAQNLAEHNPEGELPAPVVVHQTPVLFTPHGHAEMAKNPICYKCETPVAPEKPYVSFMLLLSATHDFI
jgi:hypothetical protein